MIGKTALSRIVGLLLVSAVAALGAVGWWRLWMYHGWISPPGFLHKIWPGLAGGEASYDVVFVEMSVVLFVLVGSALTILRKLRSHSER